MPAWLRAFVAASRSRVAQLKPAELAALSWALAQLCAAGSASARPAGAATLPSGPAAPGSPQAPSSSSAGPSAEDLASLACALAGHARALLRLFRPGELVSCLSALHALHPPAALPLLAAALPLLAAAAQQQRLSAQDLAMLWCLMGKVAAATRAQHKQRARAAWHAAPGEGGGAAGLPGGMGGPAAAAGTGRAAAAAGDAAADAGADGREDEEAAGRGRPDEPPFSRGAVLALAQAAERGLGGLSGQGLVMTLVGWARMGLLPRRAAALRVFRRCWEVFPAQVRPRAVPHAVPCADRHAASPPRSAALQSPAPSSPTHARSILPSPDCDVLQA